MTTDQVLKIVTDRGLRIEIRNGHPVLMRPHGNEHVTDVLLSVLKRHRERIIERIKTKEATP